MSNNQNSNDSNNSSSDSRSDDGLPFLLRFWILLLFDIASILSTCFILFFISINQRARTSIKNHILVILLIFGLAIQLIDVPFYLNFIVHSAVVPATPVTCLIWQLVDIGVYNESIFLMAWMAFERHIIVFHNQWLSTKRRRIFIHYVPICIIIFYFAVYYMYVLYFYPCEKIYDYTSMYCGYSPCYANDKNLNTWDTIVNNVIPSVFEPFITLAFICRVLWQKYRSHQPIQWRKQRKMTIQLLTLSIPDFICNFTISILYITHICGLPLDFGANILPYLYFLAYFITFIFSFICLVSMVDVKNIIREKILGRQRVAAIAPIRVTIKPTIYNATLTSKV